MNALQELTRAGGDIAQFFSAQEIARAKDYVRPLIARAWIDTALHLAELGLVLALGINRWFKRACERAASSIARRLDGGALRRALEWLWGGAGWGAALLFATGLVLALSLLDLPEEISFSYLRDKAQGLATYTPSGFAWDEAKGIAAETLAFGALAFGLYGLIRRTRRWWLVLGIGAAVAMLAAGLLDPYRARLYFDYRPLPPGPVRAAVEAVLAKGRVPYQDVVVMNAGRATARADAYFAGQGPTRLIVLYDTLVAHFTPGEIAVAVAHEMGHLREAVIGRKAVAALLMIPLLFFFHRALRAGARGGKLGFDAEGDVAGLPLLFALFAVLALVVTPVSNACQRAREADADGYALALTGDPDDFLSLMTKLAKQNRADPIPSAFVEGWMSAHPAVARRLAMGLRYERAHPERR